MLKYYFLVLEQDGLNVYMENKEENNDQKSSKNCCPTLPFSPSL